MHVRKFLSGIQKSKRRDRKLLIGKTRSTNHDLGHTFSLASTHTTRHQSHMNGRSKSNLGRPSRLAKNSNDSSDGMKSERRRGSCERKWSCFRLEKNMDFPFSRLETTSEFSIKFEWSLLFVSNSTIPKKLARRVRKGENEESKMAWNGIGHVEQPITTEKLFTRSNHKNAALDDSSFVEVRVEPKVSYFVGKPCSPSKASSARNRSPPSFLTCGIRVRHNTLNFRNRNSEAC